MVPHKTDSLWQTSWEHLITERKDEISWRGRHFTRSVSIYLEMKEHVKDSMWHHKRLVRSPEM